MTTANIRVQKLPLLVGRDAEIKVLRKAYQRVRESLSRTCEAVLVFGDSGSGKTALVQHSFEHLNDGTIFISGKFDEISTARPYSAIVDALTHLSQKTLLSENSSDDVKEKIQERLGELDLQILCKLVPALTAKFARQGGQESATAADIVENVVFAVPRFTEIVLSFLYTVADSLESPLILFLDDVQWADSESLALIASLTSLHSACRNLILVLATRVNTEYQLYRSNLVSATTGFRVEEIILNVLDLTSTNELISKTLHMSLDDTLPLSELIKQRTGGNVFFVVEFLRMLHREELLRYSMGTLRWEWNIKKIQGETNVTDNVAVLLTTKIRQLPPQVRSALQMAACLGFYFDIEILERIVSELDETFKMESVLPEKSAIWGDESSLNNSFCEAIKLACDENLVDLVTDTKYKFSHDRVQHAVYQISFSGERERIASLADWADSLE